MVASPIAWVHSLSYEGERGSVLERLGIDLAWGWAGCHLSGSRLVSRFA